MSRTFSGFRAYVSGFRVWWNVPGWRWHLEGHVLHLVHLLFDLPNTRAAMVITPHTVMHSRW